MKTQFVMAALLLFATHSATAAEMTITNAGDASHTYEYPATGMSLTDLQKALDEIRPQLPSGKDMNILRISIHDQNEIQIRTGRQDSPLAGGGRIFTFKKLSGKWVKTESGQWIS